MFMKTVIKCHSLSYVIFYAKMTLFEMSLLWARIRLHSKNPVFFFFPKCWVAFFGVYFFSVWVVFVLPSPWIKCNNPMFG